MKTFWQALVWGALAGLILGSAALLRAHATTLPDPVNVCAALHDGISLANIETALETTGISATAAGAYAGIVVRTQCPELIGLVMGQVA